MFEPCVETISTPSASEARYEPAKVASSRKLVARLTSPDRRATASPATRPPRPIAQSDSPAIRKPTAAPGKTAWLRASPMRLMRRSMRRTPIGPDPMLSARQATSARRMKPYSTKGATVAW